MTTTAILSPEDRDPTFSIWPNPNTDGQLNIRAEGSGLAEVRIFDSLGRLYKTDQFRSTGGHDPIHMALGDDLPKGIYLVHLTLEGRSSTAPLVIR